jgi:NPCBM/NEW2 domain
MTKKLFTQTKKYMSRWNIVSVLTAFCIVCACVCATSLIKGGVIAGIVFGVFGIASVYATILQWLAPQGPIPKITPREGWFLGGSLSISILVGIIILFPIFAVLPTGTPQNPLATAASTPTILQNMSPVDGPTPVLGLAVVGGQGIPHSLSYVLQTSDPGPMSTTYDLNKSFQHFHAKLSLEDNQSCIRPQDNRTCSVTFEVFSERTVRLAVQVIPFGGQPFHMNISVSGVHYLTLRVTANIDGITWTQVTAVWGDASVS